MAANTVDDKAQPNVQLVESDSEDDEATPSELLFITEPGQICYDRILPRDLSTTQKSTKVSPSGSGMLRASGEKRKVWHKKILNVFFVEKNPREDEVLEWARIWSKYCGIAFQKVDTRLGSDIRIGYNSDDGAWSYVGTDCADIPLNELTMNLGFIDRGTVLHEFGHALGLIHEHQSPGEGGFQWNRDRIIKDLSGSPNFWDKETIRGNMFYRYKKSATSGTKYDRRSIMHYSFPAYWIKGDKYPRGKPYNSKLSRLDKKLARQFYGRPKKSSGGSKAVASHVESTISTTDDKTVTSYIVPSIPAPCEDKQLPDKNVFGVPVFEPHKGVLKSSDDELFVKFRTSVDDDPKLYTIITTGDIDTLVTLLGPNNPEKFVTADDNSGDSKNAKLELVLFPDSDYYLLIRTFDSDGGEFKLSITAA